MQSTQSGLRYSSAEFMSSSTIALVRQLEGKKDFAPGEAEGVGLIVYPEFELLGPKANFLLNDSSAFLSALGEALDFDELERVCELLSPLSADQVNAIDMMRSDLPEAGRSDRRPFKATTDPAVNPFNLDASLELMADVAEIADDVLRLDPNAGIFIYGHGPRNGIHARIGTDSLEAFQAHEEGSGAMSRRLIALEKKGPGLARFRAEKPLPGGSKKDQKALAHGMTGDLLEERQGLILGFDPQGVLLLSEIEAHKGFAEMIDSLQDNACRANTDLGRGSIIRPTAAK